MNHDPGSHRRRRSPRPTAVGRRAAVGLLVAGAALLIGAALLVVGGRGGEVAAPEGSTVRDAPTAWQPAADPRDGVPPTVPGRAEDREGAAPETETRTAASDARQPLPVAVEVPAIGVRSELIDLDIDADRRLEVPEDPAIAGWYVRAPRPGEDGPAIVAGHVDSHRGPGVFWRLRELEPGDRVVVERADGSEVVFTVDRLEQWPKDRFPTDAVYRDADGPELRLITCGGAFDTEARSYQDNLIVFASLAGEGHRDGPLA